MGYEWRDVSPIVRVRVSRHNSERDARDDALADEIENRLHEYAEELLAEPRYEPISPTMT